MFFKYSPSQKVGPIKSSKIRKCGKWKRQTLDFLDFFLLTENKHLLAKSWMMPSSQLQLLKQKICFYRCISFICFLVLLRYFFKNPIDSKAILKDQTKVLKSSPKLLDVTTNQVQNIENYRAFVKNTTIPIVYIYTISENVCADKNMERDLSYISHSLKQLFLIQSVNNSNVYFASNFAECRNFFNIMHNLNETYRPTLIDTADIASKKTLKFQSLSNFLFQHDKRELWVNSALRFFLLEDLMATPVYKGKFSDLFHVESDNMLYGDLNKLNFTLRSKYTYRNNLALTPLTINKGYITASVLW